MILLLITMLLYGASAFTFDSYPQNLVSVNVTDDWQPCYIFAASESSATFTDIRNLCGNGPFAFGQTNAIDPTLYSVVYRSFRNVTIDLAVNTTGTLNNYTTFFTTTSFGLGLGAIYDCSTASAASTVLCWNVNYTAGEYRFSPGGFTNANDGYQTQPTIFRVIYSAPCYFAANGSACSVPSFGMCQPGVCLGNPTCDNGTLVAPPVPAPDSCKVPIECDPYTGNYTLANATDGSACFGGDYCISDYGCLGGQCVSAANVSAVCPLPANQCLLAPTCASNGTAAICTYLPNTGAICQADSAYLCRTNDVCSNAGVCVPGVDRTSLLPITDCINSYVCNNVTGNITSVVNPFGTPCNTSNPCLAPGVCNNTLCYSNTPKPIPGDSFCFPGTCDPITGNITYNIANTGLQCTPPGPSLLCQVYVCMVGNCTFAGPATCPNVACYTSSCTNDLIGCELTPQNATMCSTGSFCAGQGMCVQGNATYSECVLSGSIDCTSYQPANYDPLCGFYYCDNSLNTCVANTTGVLGTQCSSNPCVPLSASKCKADASCGGAIVPNLPSCVLSNTERMLSFFV
jgi:hypothetical protein